MSLRSGGDGLRPQGVKEHDEFASSFVPSPPEAAQPPPPPSPPEAAPRLAPPRQRRKGPRPKHVPQRMCAACREHDTKRALYRIVRTPEGTVEPDPTGRRNGRGAYLCGQASCWQRGLTGGVLARALNVEIDSETIDALRRYAATLPLESAKAAGVAATQGGKP
ncbi:MAG: YlxR family protein [Thermomicrobiales bacterium]